MDSLRQRKFSGKVNGVRLSAHITFPDIASAFTPAAGFFFAPKSAANFRAARSDINIGNSAIAAGGAQKLLRFPDAVTENSGA